MSIINLQDYKKRRGKKLSDIKRILAPKNNSVTSLKDYKANLELLAQSKELENRSLESIEVEFDRLMKSFLNPINIE